MSRYTYEETRTSYLELSPGVELKVEAHVEGWADPGGLDTPPDGDEKMEVTAVELLAYGKVLDLTDLWTVNADGDLEDVVEEAMEKI